jgi:hypothetical protein
LLVITSSNLFADDVKNGIVYSWWDWHVLENPGNVFGDQHANWWEEVFAEQDFLCLIPGKSVLVTHHEVMHESVFLGGGEAMRVVLLNDVETGLVVAVMYLSVLGDPPLVDSLGQVAFPYYYKRHDQSAKTIL